MSLKGSSLYESCTVYYNVPTALGDKIIDIGIGTRIDRIRQLFVGRSKPIRFNKNYLCSKLKTQKFLTVAT